MVPLADNYDKTLLDVTDTTKEEFNIELVKPVSEKINSKNGSTGKRNRTEGATVFIKNGSAAKVDMNNVDVSGELKNGKWLAIPKNQLTFFEK